MGATTARPMRLDELDEIHAVYDRMQRSADGRAFPIPRAYLDVLFTRPGLHPDVDLVAVEHEGALVAAVVALPSPPYSEIEYYPGIDPGLADAPGDAADEVVRAVLLAVDASARARLDEPGAAERLMLVGAPRGEQVLTPRLADHGFTALRSSYEMQIDLVEPVPAAQPPEGVRIEVYDDAQHRAEMLAVVAEAFADHHGDEAPTPESLEHSLALPDRVPELTLIARDDEGAVGSAWGMLRDDGGYISTVGVVRRARGRGVAGALLQQCFRGFAELGVLRVTLDVDADSLTGATRVYERVGMRTVAATDLWARPVV